MSEHDAESDAPRVCHVCADPSKATWQIRGLLWCIDDAVAHGVARVENDARPWRWVACSITEFGHVGEGGLTDGWPGPVGHGPPEGAGRGRRAQAGGGRDAAPSPGAVGGAGG